MSDLSVATIGSGLTKREYFAAMALQGILFWDATMNDNEHAGKPDLIAKQTLLLADAIIAELEKLPAP